jgi:hypothetical protein
VKGKKMSTTYEPCPVCGKKGLYRYVGWWNISMECRYHQGWVISKWNSNKRRMESIDPAIIQKCIDAAKRAWEAKK